VPWESTPTPCVGTYAADAPFLPDPKVEASCQYSAPLTAPGECCSIDQAFTDQGAPPGWWRNALDVSHARSRGPARGTGRSTICRGDSRDPDRPPLDDLRPAGPAGTWIAPVDSHHGRWSVFARPW